MKRVLSISFMLIAMNIVYAQSIPLTTDGAFEVKEVVDVDGVGAQQLYDRAMMALSRWTTSKSENNLDYHDRDAGILILKGLEYMGFKNTFMGAGWERYINYSLTVRCKDGRAQVTIVIPNIVFIYNTNGIKRILTIEELKQLVDQSKKKRKERGQAILSEIQIMALNFCLNMVNALKNTGSSNFDDDF